MRSMVEEALPLREASSSYLDLSFGDYQTHRAQ